jgi:trimethylamine:corrinoid methyltransferase-like protein
VFHVIATFKDLEDFVCLQDALKSVHIMLSLLIYFVDVPKKNVYRRCYEAVVKNSPKHSINQADSVHDVRLELATGVMGWDEIDSFAKHPIFSMIYGMTPPSKLGGTSLQVLIGCTKHGVPIHIETDCSRVWEAHRTLEHQMFKRAMRRQFHSLHWPWMDTT